MSHDPLRPTTLADFAGQPVISKHLGIILDAAERREELCGHLLLTGPPGLGKTTLAAIVARELGVPMEATSGPVLEKPKDVVSLLAGLAQPTVLFIDEIHRLPAAVEEILYPAMEDGELDFQIGEGSTARLVRVAIEPFVLIGATTQLGALSAPFRDRFSFAGRLKPYGTDALAGIVQRSAELLGMSLSKNAAALIAGRSRGTPRVSNANLRLVRDWAEVHESTDINSGHAGKALDAFGIDSRGLDHLALDILSSLVNNFQGGPVGVGTLAASINEAVSTVESYEPFLMAEGLITRTPRGREATLHCYEHLGITAPASLTSRNGTETLWSEALPGTQSGVPS